MTLITVSRKSSLRPLKEVQSKDGETESSIDSKDRNKRGFIKLNIISKTFMKNKKKIPKMKMGIKEINYDESVESFDELNLKPGLLRSIYGYGFEKPSTIRQKAILPSPLSEGMMLLPKTNLIKEKFPSSPLGIFN